jgi:hypothetical protein
MEIKKFNQFILEEISGTELVGPIGPAYGETGLQNKTINKSHTSVIGVDGQINPNAKNNLTNDLFFEEDYNQILNDYIKGGGDKSELTGNISTDISIMLDYLQEK